MPSDRRVRYTQAAIRKAFLDLMQDKHHGRITVTEICEAADINRATFYRHYRDPLDLLEKIEREVTQGLLDRREALERDPENQLASMLAEMRRDPRMYDVLLSDNGDTAFPGRLLDAFREAIDEDAKRWYPGLSEVQLRWLYAFASQGCAAVIRDWASSGMAEDPTEVAQFLQQLIAGTRKVCA